MVQQPYLPMLKLKEWIFTLKILSLKKLKFQVEEEGFVVVFIFSSLVVSSFHSRVPSIRYSSNLNLTKFKCYNCNSLRDFLTSQKSECLLCNWNCLFLFSWLKLLIYREWVSPPHKIPTHLIKTINWKREDKNY